MSDDLPLDHLADSLRKSSSDERELPRSEAELDAEFDEIMSFMANLDHGKAAELDECAARARQDLRRPPDDPST